jgi:hypothetical protein
MQGMGITLNGVFSAIGQGLGYVWDSIKVALSSIGAAFSLILDSIGFILDGFKALVDLAKKVPGHPEWIDDLSKNWGDSAKWLHDRSASMRQFHIDSVNTFGNSAKAAKDFFAGLQAQAAKPLGAPNLDNLNRQLRPPVEATYQAIKPLIEGSAEAYSYELRWKGDAQGVLNGDDPKELARELNKDTKHNGKTLEKIAELLGDSGLLTAAD